jgi:hypothetical protein
MTWWPFNKAKRAEELDSSTEFKKRIAESHARSGDLEQAAERLKVNRENIHKRAQQLLGEENVRHPLKSTPG